MKKLVKYISLVTIMMCLVGGVSVGTLPQNASAKTSSRIKSVKMTKKKALKYMKKKLASCEKKLKMYKNNYKQLETTLAKAKEEDKDVILYNMNAVKERIYIYTEMRRSIKKDIKRIKKAKPGTTFIGCVSTTTAMP